MILNKIDPIRSLFLIGVSLMMLGESWLLREAQAQGVSSEKEARETLQSVSAQIKKIGENLNANRKLLKSEHDKISLFEQKIAEQQQKLAISRKKIEENETELSRLETQRNQLTVHQNRHLISLKALIKERYKAGTPDAFRLILNQESAHAVGRMQNYYHYFHQAQSDKIARIKSELSIIAELEKKQETLLQDIKTERSNLALKNKQLNQAKEERLQQVVKLKQKITNNKTQLASLEADRNRLNSLLVKIIQKARELEAAKLREERAKQLQEQKRLASQSQVLTPRLKIKGGFKKHKGKLLPPVDAQLKYKFGARMKNTGMKAQGNFYNTEANKEVVAIFKGQVIFAGYLKGYGLLMIVDHGDEHISLYGHNDVLLKKVGDLVNTQEVISTSGVSGGLENPGLYFEIRHNAAPVNPNNWLRRG